MAPENLPQSVRDLIDLVGHTPAMALVSAFPGVTIRVPSGHLVDGTMRLRLVEIMGEAAASAFMQAYRGERIPIPRCLAALRDSRDRRIIAAYDAGTPVSTLAMEHWLTERQIRTILKRTPGETVAGLPVGPGIPYRQERLF